MATKKEEELTVIFTGVAAGFAVAHFMSQLAERNKTTPWLEFGSRDMLVVPMITGLGFSYYLSKTGAKNLSKGVFAGTCLLSFLVYLKLREKKSGWGRFRI